MTEKHDIGFAVEMLKQGKKVRRKVQQCDGFTLTLQTPDKYSKMTIPYIYGESGGQRMPWQLCHIDLLATDWEVVE